VFDADVAYPFLDAVGAGFVEGLAFFDVVKDFVVVEMAECDF